MPLKRTILLAMYVIGFITIYFLFIIFTYITPLNWAIPVIQFIGFAGIIAGFFYVFLHLVKTKENRTILEFRFLNEQTIMLFLLILMSITFFVPPITFSEMVIDWSQIAPLNYFRAIIFLVGITFVPGFCIFNLVFPNSTLHLKFDVEPFFLKLILYPIISITFLGSITLLFDRIGFLRESFPILLFFSIIILYIISTYITKRRNKTIDLFASNKITISKHSAFILYIAICIIIIAFGLHTLTQYLQELDGYRAINYAGFIATEEAEQYNIYSNYAIYWGYISFALNALTGIPAINANALLFPFLYLFVCSLYLLIKSILGTKNTVYAILATLFAITFSSLFYIVQSFHPHERIPLFIFDGVFNFRYKSFALILFFVSLSLFISSFKPYSMNSNNNKRFEFKLDLKPILLSSFLLIQSFMIYFFPVIPFIAFLICLYIVTKEKTRLIRMITFFLGFSFLLLILFDLVSQFLFSWMIYGFLNYFFGIQFPFIYLNYTVRLVINAVFIYSTFVGIIVSIVLFSFLMKFMKKKLNFPKFRITANKKLIYYTILIVITILLALDILLNIIRTLRALYKFTLFLHLIFFDIGFIGIVALYLLYYTYKLNKGTFYTLAIWLILSMIIALAGFFLDVFKYPNLSPLSWPENDYAKLIDHWFDRMWYYSIVPISIFASIGIINLMRRLSLKKVAKWRFNFKSPTIALAFCSTIIFFSLSNTIISGIAFQNRGNTIITSEEAQMIGWVSENLPPESNITVDRKQLNKFLGEITSCNTKIMSEFVGIASYVDYTHYISRSLDNNCSIDYVERLDSFDRVITFSDNNTDGNIFIGIFNTLFFFYGYCEFFWKSSNTSNGFWFNCSRFDFLNGISLFVNASELIALNGTTYQKIADVESNLWHKFKIIYECSANNYSGLDQYQWKVAINEIEYGPFNMRNDVSYMSRFDLYTSDQDANWNVFLAGFNFSGDSTFKLEYSLFPYLRLFDYLDLLNLQYMILSKEPTPQRLELENYIDIETKLIAKFYKTNLYEYGNLEIYKADF